MSDNHPLLNQQQGGGPIFNPQAGTGGPSRSRDLNSSTFSIRNLFNNNNSNANSTAAISCGDVQHVCYLSEHIGSLYLNDNYSDVVIKVENTDFRAHRVILAARSEYFR